MLGALLPGIAARLQEQGQEHYPDTNNTGSSSDGATTSTAAYRLAAKLLPALWRLAPALPSHPSPSAPPLALGRQLAALIAQAESLLLASSASAAPAARVGLLASLARQHNQHQHQRLPEEEGQEGEAAAVAAAAAAAAFLRRLATATVTGLVEDGGMGTLDGDALAVLLGALGRVGVEPLREEVTFAVEARARALLPTMPLPVLARFSAGVTRCTARGYAPSRALLQAEALALRRHLEALALVEVEEGGAVPAAWWGQVGEVMHALAVLGDGCGGSAAGG